MMMKDEDDDNNEVAIIEKVVFDEEENLDMEETVHNQKKKTDVPLIPSIIM